MGVNRTRFGAEVYPDGDALNRLVQNDIYLESVMPRVILRYPGTTVKTSSGQDSVISGGIVKITKRFKGSSDIIEIKMPVTPKPGPPIFTATPHISYAGTAYIVGWTPGYRAVKVRITLLDKTKQTTATLHWQAICGV